MTMTTILPTRIPDAIPVESDAPRLYSAPSRPSEPPPETEGGGGLKPLAYLKYRWATVVFLGAAVGGVLATAAYTLIPAKYTTYSIIRVSPQDPRIYYNEDPHGRGDFASYLKTQAGMLRSHHVLNAAIRDPEIAALPMLKEQPDPVRFLEEELLIDFQDGSELIKPKLSGDDPRALTMIVNAIHSAFFREIVEAERTRKQARLKQMENAVTKMQGELEKKFAVPVDQPGDQPAESLPGVGPNLAASQVARLREKLSSVEEQQRKLEDEKKRYTHRLANVEAELPPVPGGYVAQLENDPQIAGINVQVAKWQKQLAYQLQLNADPEKPTAKDLRQKIGDAAQDRERVRTERVEEYRKSRMDEYVRGLKTESEKLDAELEGLVFVRDRTIKDMKEYEAKLAKILPPTDKPKDLDKVDTLTRSEIVEGMIQKGNLLKLELSAPSRVTSFQEAALPMKREVKKQLLGTAAAGLIGFAMVGLGVVAFESRVKRAMTVGDVQRATLGPILGAIPRVETATGRPTPDLALAEEGIEKVRANLMLQFGRPSGKVIVIASAVGDEGRPFFARELALSFARAGGRTLLADFDLRTPRLHETFDVPNERGFCELLMGTCDLSAAATVLPWGIAFLPAGRWADAVRQHLSFERIADLLGDLRGQFDYVIVNSHPILSVAETAHAGRAADAVVLTVEKYESRLPLVSRAQEKIAALAPEAFGVVVLGASRDECLQ